MVLKMSTCHRLVLVYRWVTVMALKMSTFHRPFDGWEVWLWRCHIIFSVVEKSLKFFFQLSKFITNDSEKLKRQLYALLWVSDHLYSCFYNINSGQNHQHDGSWLIMFLGNPLLSQILKKCLVSQTSQNMTDVLISSFLWVHTTITRSIDFLYKLRSLLAALSRKKKLVCLYKFGMIFSDECFLQHI